MLYDIACIADIHWDALEPKKQYSELQFFNQYVEKVPHLNLVVIAGDVFNTKILLNSKTSILAMQWMDELVNICGNRSIPIRIIKGTNSHDNNQLDTFQYRGDLYPDWFFKIFNETTTEETLPGLQCLYCPDEVMTTDEWERKYYDLLMGHEYDCMFFHGSFDCVLPSISLQESELTGARSIAFRYSHFARIARVMVGGHWHDGSDNEKPHMYYTRSYSRWCFGENHPKGFIHLTYDTDDKSYVLQRVENPYADKYKTYQIDTRSMQTMEEYQAVIKVVNDALQDPTVRVRIHIYETDLKPLNETAIEMLRRYYINQNRRIKIVVRNELKEEIRKKDEEKTEEIRSRFQFVTDKNLSIPEIIQRFIMETKKVDLPIDEIDGFVQKYLTKS